jgi:hypothetical protein
MTMLAARLKAPRDGLARHIQRSSRRRCLSPMEGEELAALVEDIEKHGVRVPVAFWGKYDGNGRFHGELIDGRNRLEAAERAGLDLDEIPRANLTCGDPVSWIIALNIHRRHLTKQKQLDLIVAARMAVSKPGHDGPVCKGGRGKVNPVKAAVITDAKAAGLDASERTIKRVIAKAEGRKPKKKAPAIPRAMIREMDEIQAELERRGVDYCRVSVLDAKQSKAMGGPAEPRIGWYSATACTGDAAEKAFNEAVIAVRAAKGETPKPEADDSFLERMRDV